MRAIVSLLFNDTESLVSSLQALQYRDTAATGMIVRTASGSSEAASTHQFSRDALALLLGGGDQAGQVDTITPVTLRRLLNALYYLCKKTEKLFWYDMMTQSCGGDCGCDKNCLIHQKWMFGQVLALLVHPGFGSNANIDMVLHVIQDILEPLANLSIPTVNALVSRRGNLPSPDPVCESSASTSSLDSRRAKRVRIDPVAVEMVPEKGLQGAGSSVDGNVTAESASDGNEQPVSGIISSASRAPYKAIMSGSVLRIKCDIPFPVLDDTCASILAGVVRYEECGGTFPSRLGRILSTLSLHDGNWIKLLECLRSVAEGIALQATSEARNIQQILADIIEKNGDAAVAMALPHLSTPSTVSELRLLHVLRLITNLRSPSPGSEDDTSYLAVTVSEVAETIRKIDFQDLWDLLVGILDLVRRLEGIREQEILEDDEDIVGT
ncbi:unnamed protein product, partial [Symbiodinium microadriaticum]